MLINARKIREIVDYDIQERDGWPDNGVKDRGRERICICAERNNKEEFEMKGIYRMKWKMERRTLERLNLKVKSKPILKKNGLFVLYDKLI